MLARPKLTVFALVCGLAGYACSTETIVRGLGGPTTPPPNPTETENGGCAETETANPVTGECVSNGPTGGAELGNGTPESVTFTQIYAAKKKTTELVDLAFAEKDPTQLWVIGYGDDVVHVGSGVTGEANGTWKEYYDPAAMHFMHKPPAFAMGANGFWGICGDNDNSQNDPRMEPNYFMGPALFTSDLTIFAKATPDGLGSHYDMLHNTSFCRGIAWVEGNWFWTFNGELGSLEKYNFAKDHGPGNDDHSDGEIYRYAKGQVKGVEGVSSHLVYDPSDKFLYIADTGNKRIGKLDTTSGTEGARLPRRNETLVKGVVMDGTKVVDVVPAGTLEQPSGIELKGGLIYVTDTATSTFHVFDKAGTEVKKLATGLEPGSLSGFTFGPDGKIWFTDRKAGKVLRIDPVAQ
ncbi:MAG TPA: hypothetical protein VM925_03170 [Labilithrix sp.]|nr:hypothetical protein [Labilithrix sp.]